jgi:transposase InsO family protein
MRAAGLVGVSRRKWITTTVRDRDARPAPDLVERNFVAPGPNRLWVADITYSPTWAGFLYLAVVLDAFSRRIVGQQQQQAQSQNAQVAGYQRAMAACLQGRGYNVN